MPLPGLVAKLSLQQLAGVVLDPAQPLFKRLPLLEFLIAVLARCVLFAVGFGVFLIFRRLVLLLILLLILIAFLAFLILLLAVFLVLLGLLIRILVGLFAFVVAFLAFALFRLLLFQQLFHDFLVEDRVFVLWIHRQGQFVRGDGLGVIAERASALPRFKCPSAYRGAVGGNADS